MARRPVRTRKRWHMTDRRPEPQPVAAPIWKRDFPYEAAAEEEVTRREFARYLVAGAGALALGNVGLAAWTQLRTINDGEPRAIVDAASCRGTVIDLSG